MNVVGVEILSELGSTSIRILVYWRWQEYLFLRNPHQPLIIVDKFMGHALQVVSDHLDRRLMCISGEFVSLFV